MNRFNRIFNLLVDIGTILISCDSEILRVIDTLDIIAKTYNIQEFNSFIITNGLFITATHDGISHAKSMQIRNHSANLGKIEAVNSLSRKIAYDGISLEQAEQILSDIKKQRVWNKPMRCFGAIIGCSSVTVLFKGTFLDGFLTIFIAMFSFFFLDFLQKKRINSLLLNMLTSAFITILSILGQYFGLCDNLDKVIIGAIMPLVPGILLTNGIRDISNNDFLSGIIRVIEAVLIGFSIALGVGLVFRFI